jgi:hypothetical protein
VLYVRSELQSALPDGPKAADIGWLAPVPLAQIATPLD